MEYIPAAIPPAAMAPKFAINHALLLKPIMLIMSKGSKPSEMSDLAKAST